MTATLSSRPDRVLSRPRNIAGALSGGILSLIFLASGLWKISDLPSTAERITQLLIPGMLSLPAAFAVSFCETLAAVLLLIPSCRRWGAWLAALMLAGFMAYFAIFYSRLTGEDCSCFPWVRRVVGPAFFVGDAAMLLMAIAAGAWSVRQVSVRKAVIAASAVALLVCGSYSASMIRRAHADVPDLAVVDGKPAHLQSGRVLLYFFDPQCTHCEAIARKMAKWDWGETRVVALPTAEPRWAASFLKDTGLRAGVCLEAERLRKIFPFTTAPHGVVIENGKLVRSFNFGELESAAYYAVLKQSGHVR
jgi:uncharacterized membrane protein YphA (DoxX/SURF4 family)